MLSLVMTEAWQLKMQNAKFKMAKNTNKVDFVGVFIVKIIAFFSCKWNQGKVSLNHRKALNENTEN